MKLAVIVGHTKSAQGANNYKGVSEYVWNGKVATLMAANAPSFGIEVKVFYRDVGGVSAAAKAAKAWGANASLELHFNAAGAVAYGCECLVLKGDVVSAKLADKLTDGLAKKYSLRERRITELLPTGYDGDGVYELESGARGYSNLAAVKAAGINVRLLLEPCFMDTKNSESQRIIDDQEGYAKFLLGFFAAEAGVQIPELPSTPVPPQNSGGGNLQDLVKAVKDFSFSSTTMLGSIKPYLLAQFMLETARGTSKLFVDHLNPGGLKWRDGLNVQGASQVSYTAHDGLDTYARFETLQAALYYYQAFIGRSVYLGFQGAIAEGGGKAYIEHIKKAGYAEDAKYVEKVLALVPEAITLLGEDATPAPVDPPSEPSGASSKEEVLSLIEKLKTAVQGL